MTRVYNSDIHKNYSADSHSARTHRNFHRRQKQMHQLLSSRSHRISFADAPISHYSKRSEVAERQLSGKPRAENFRHLNFGAGSGFVIWSVVRTRLCCIYHCDLVMTRLCVRQGRAARQVNDCVIASCMVLLFDCHKMS